MLVDWLFDRVKNWGAPLPRGTRMSPADTHPDQAELRRLLDRHAKAWDGFAYNNDEDRRGLAAAIVTVAAENAGWPETSPFLKDFADIVDHLLLTETAFQPYSLPAPITALSLLDVGEIADDMRHRIEIISDSQLLIRGLVHVSHIIEATLAALPESLAMSADMPFPLLTVDLVATAERPHDVMTFALATFMRNEDFDKTGLFSTVRRQLYRNILEASGVLINPDLPLLHHDTDNPVLPFECKREPAIEVADRYFGMTPLTDLFCIPLPLTIPDAVRFEHMHVLAGTGHGKTQTLQHLIVADLLRPIDEVPAMVVLDSQGDMLDVLKRIRLFDPTIEGNAYAERLLIVDPSDVHFTPALNLFDIQSDRLANYDLRDREQVLAGIIEIYDYIFGGLLGAELTQKQSMVFRFLAQLMLAIPGSTIHTLRELLEDASPYTEAIASLPDTARGFFENHFFGKGYQPTREQILRRLYGVLQNPSFERMFAHPRNRLDLFDVLNRGGIVLVNTAKDFLKSEASSIFGRFIIALTLKAAMERATLHPSQRRPTFLWIDEASEY
ncbi:MAG TPA: hypothetical protein PLG99_10660, partial [Kaistiaceae bacterium]|nr:hypothetical protein [Kaistiaceae bacterium]